MAGPPDDEKLAAMIAGLDPDDVADLLVRAALEHDDVARAVRLAAADDGDRLQVLRQAVDGSLRTRRFLDYWASSRWAADAAPVVDALRQEGERQQSKELVALIERGIGHLVKVLLTADDSNGEIGSLARELLQVHAEVCDAGVADPAALAKWMVRFTFEDQDFFNVDPVRYRAALGDDGLATYRREVTKRADKADDAEPARRPYAVDYATQRLAILDRDVDTLVALLGQDLSNAYQFERVAEAMLELDNPDAALEWARRGIVETSGWQVAKLYDLAAGLLADRADNEGVFELRLHHHERMPSSTTYRQLRTAAEQLGRWDTERAAARSVLEQRSPTGFVDALLDDGDTATAWAAADANPQWHLDARQWERLADARQPDHPADALDVYLQLADAALVDANKNAYRTGVKHLKAARAAATAAGIAADFDARMALLREQHRRRPTLIAMLDKAKLP
jgi:uncharacterized Zn finger protein